MVFSGCFIYVILSNGLAPWQRTTTSTTSSLRDKQFYNSHKPFSVGIFIDIVADIFKVRGSPERLPYFVSHLDIRF